MLVKVCKQWLLFCHGLSESQGRVAGGERDSSDNKDLAYCRKLASYETQGQE